MYLNVLNNQQLGLSCNMLLAYMFHSNMLLDYMSLSRERSKNAR